MDPKHPDFPEAAVDNVVELAAFRKHLPHASGGSGDDRPDVRDPLVRHLVGRGRVMKPSTEQILDEIDTCGLDDIVNAATRAEYLRMIEHFAVFVGAYEHDLLSADQRHVRKFKSHLLRDDAAARRLTANCPHCTAGNRRAAAYSDSYVKRHLAAVRAGYKYLVTEGLVAVDPTYGVKRPTANTRRQYVPTVEEVERLFAYRGTARSRLLVRLAYFAPARRFELATLRWKDIDEFAIWRFTAKGHKAHGLKLHPEVLRALRDYSKAQEREAARHPAMRAALDDPETAYVFLTKSGKPITPGHLVRILKRHAVHAGVGVIPATASAKDPKTGKSWDSIDGKTSRLSPHALRRAWSSHSMNDPNTPVPIDVVSKVLGHASIETTRRHYAFTDDGRAWDALTKRRLA